MQEVHNIDLGAVLPIWSLLPFIGMLLSIALFPLFAPKFWHDHFDKVSVFWALVIIVPFLFVYKWLAVHEFLYVVLADYIPFIILLASLYTVSGGILLKGTPLGTPLVNTCMLAIGTVIASWMGTTGASMLLIRPFLRANRHREKRTFMVVFFIFLIANVGGSLTPLGDPPLFLGFLRGVPFFWTFNLFPQMAMAAIILLALYFVFDLYFYRKEGVKKQNNEESREPLKIEGGHNIFFLLAIMGAVLMSGMVKMGEVSILGVHLTFQDMLRDAVLIFIVILSMATTRREVREDNGFTWFPMKEVAILFAGIFLTMVPCLKMLQAGTKGELSFLVENMQEPVHYFWITGSLSAFLDNAPTYLTFLSTLLGKFYPGVEGQEAVLLLIRENGIYLKAISVSAVFFGASTYIGNAPNFMVRSIAEETGTEMPSFFGYQLKYSLPILIPVFALIAWLFYL
ncbi:MAG TPA: sodium:proton antiporter [Nitrospirae bacterium]|nr:citrate transporter [bacterium BMS3Abin10]GBE38503.1 citrate transporter [bacterium BMS3Bbin08]HDH51175.1 sodium:proton antiporter [Nitrospirota bacterium]HDK82014.1 sodium:proton antiporter [Nitrospirota bacterium]HDO26206.1 sodium:proton antiporter [Nitrospirota bacterium]